MRMLQIGLGGFGRKWAAITRPHLVAVVDPDPAARAWAVAELGLAPERAFATLTDALADGGFTTALVASPPDDHHASCARLLEAGIDVLVEKPLATTLADARELVAIADRTGRILMVSQNYRFRPHPRAVQAAVRSGMIGNLVSVRIACRRNTRGIFGAGNFRYEMEHPYILDMAIHHVDLLRALTGREVLRVDARSWSAPDSEYRHHPSTLALMDLDGGVPVVYEGDWAARGGQTSWNADWELVGSLGRLTWVGDVDDHLQGVVTLARWGEAPRTLRVAPQPAVDQEATLAAFIDAVASRRPPETSAADNIRSLAIVLACVESIESGAPRELPVGHAS